MEGKRRNLYGGERGIRNRGDTVTQHLRTFAKSDFMHDFGEDVDTRDKYTDKDNIRFIEIVRGYGVGLVKAATVAFNAVLNKNPYKLIGNNISAIYPGAPNNDAKEFVNERAILKLIGLDYDGKGPTSLKNRIRAAKAGRPDGVDPIRIGQVDINIPGGGMWNYNVTAVPMKVRGETPNISTLFSKVTGNKTKFALIIDAAGGLSMTGLKNTDLDPLPDQACEFYIIENIENDSDSATKVKNFDKPKNASRSALAPTVSFLKDVNHTVVYPPFNVLTQQVPAEVLFGNATMVLSRAGDETEADFTYGPEETYHIENVSQNANVKNASLNLLATAVKDGFTLGRDGVLQPPSGSVTKEPFLFPYLKRVGDWCQSLSLLDLSREYHVYDETHTQTTTRTSLKTLKENDVEVALVTMDRILLAYALSLGTDVFFTTGSDLGLLLYFKNTDIELTPEQLTSKNDSMKAEIDTYSTPEKAAGIADNAQRVKDAAIASILTATTDVEYIRLLRAGLYRSSVVRNDFANLVAKIAELDGEIPTVSADPKRLNQVLFDKLTILKKMEVDHNHNKTQIASITTYPSLALDNPTYATMASRPESRGAITKLMMIIKDMFNDVVQSKDVFETAFMRKEAPPNQTPMDPTRYGAVWEAFKILKSAIETDGAMKGGALDNVNGLMQFIVTPLSEQEYKRREVSPDVVDEPLPLVLGSYYRDQKGQPYTVVNEFMITKEDLPIFKQIEPGDFTRLSAEQQKFLSTRILLLYADLLRGELEHIVASEDDIITPEINPIDKTEVVDAMGNPKIMGSEPSDTKKSNHIRVYYIANQLQNTLATFMQNGQWSSAYVDAFNTYNGSYLLDNDGIRAVMVGKEGPRNPNDYSRTFQKIETLRSSLIAMITSRKRQRPEEVLIPTKRRAAGRTPHKRKQSRRRTRRSSTV